VTAGGAAAEGGAASLFLKGLSTAHTKGNLRNMYKKQHTQKATQMKGHLDKSQNKHKAT